MTRSMVGSFVYSITARPLISLNAPLDIFKYFYYSLFSYYYYLFKKVQKSNNNRKGWGKNIWRK
jgi:hypothetical protein